jgi:ketosteroid isomerase-like protein
MSDERNFDPAEVEATLRALVAVLEDPDPKRRVDAYTSDAIFVMEGSPPVHGRAEMLDRDPPVLYDVTVVPERIEGCHHFAVADGRFTCFLNRTAHDRGVPVAMHLLMHLRKEIDGVWRIAHESLVAERNA